MKTGKWKPQNEGRKGDWDGEGVQGRRRRDERMKGWMIKGWGVRVQCRRVVLGDRPHWIDLYSPLCWLLFSCKTGLFSLPAIRHTTERPWQALYEAHIRITPTASTPPSLNPTIQHPTGGRLGNGCVLSGWGMGTGCPRHRKCLWKTGHLGWEQDKKKKRRET